MADARSRDLHLLLAPSGDRTLMGAAGDSLNAVGRAVEAFGRDEYALDEALFGARQLVAVLEALETRRGPLP